MWSRHLFEVTIGGALIVDCGFQNRLGIFISEIYSDRTLTVGSTIHRLDSKFTPVMLTRRCGLEGAGAIVYCIIILFSAAMLVDFECEFGPTCDTDHPAHTAYLIYANHICHTQ
jgi:hypothetical protein